MVVGSSRIFLVAVLLCLSIPVAHSSKEFWCDEGVNQAALEEPLNAFYLKTQPMSWSYNHLWGSNTCPCEWFGVDCDTKNGTVFLKLQNNGIQGTIPTAFCSDIFSHIDFSNNSLSGTVPSCIGSMQKLKILSLSDNHLQGLLPDTLGSLSKLNKLEVSYNLFTGPFPDYLQCPRFFFGDDVHIQIKNNSFWCPGPEWCSKKQCADCMPEPSPACTNQNKFACSRELKCCYASTWESDCDDLINKTSMPCESDSELPKGCDPKNPKLQEESDDSSYFWVIPVSIVLFVVLAFGCLATFGITLYKRNWSFSQQRHTLVKTDSETYSFDPDDSIYQDEVPPRSSLDYEL